MLKKLKACCGCGKNDVIVPEHNPVGKSPALSEKDEYVNDLQMRESGVVNPMRDISHETMNPAYMSFQTAPSLLNRTNQTEQPDGEVYKPSDADSGMSEPLNV